MQVCFLYFQIQNLYNFQQNLDFWLDMQFADT